MTKIDFDAFICSIMSFDPVSNEVKYLIKEAIRLQGLEYKNGKIVEVAQPSLTEEQKDAWYKCIYPFLDEDGYPLFMLGEQAPLSKILRMGVKEGEVSKHFKPNIECTKLSYPIGSQVFVKSLKRLGEIVKTYKEGCVVKEDTLKQFHTYDELEPIINLKDKPQTIKFNEPLTNAEKRYFDKILFNDVRYKPIDFDKVDINKMVEEYKEEESKVLLPLGFSKGNIEHLSIAYKNGIEDMLKLIKEGGE